MTYTNEFYSGFSFQLTARTRKDESSYLIPFLKKEGDTYTPVKDFSISAAELKLRYASNEKFFQTRMEPIFPYRWMHRCLPCRIPLPEKDL